jgi:hypothetical protein
VSQLAQQVCLCEELAQVCGALEHIGPQPLDCHLLLEAQQRVHQLRSMHVSKATLAQQLTWQQQQQQQQQRLC